MKKESELDNLASKMMIDGKGNCSQAIFAKYAPKLEKGNIDFDTCMRITSAFGGGINLTGNVCGAITGALMTLGLKYGENFQEVMKISTQFIDEFKSINGSIICRDLVGHDFFDNEDLRKTNNKEIFEKCKKCVDDAACLLEKYIDELKTPEGKQI